MIRRSLLFIALTLAAPAAPQTPDQRGREILGLVADVLRVTPEVPRYWFVEGSGAENLTGELQGLKADEPTWRPHQERVAVDYQEQAVAWERRTPRNDESLRNRRFVYAPARTIVVDHANGITREIPGEVPASRRRALMRRIPHLLIADIVSRSASQVRWVRSLDVEGERADEIEITLPSEGTLRLIAGQSPAVVLSVSYDLHFPGRGDTTVVWRWTGWKEDPRAGFAPSGHRLEIDGVVFQDVVYSRFAFDEAAARAMLEPPLQASPAAHDEAPEWARGAGSATGEVAPGVHVARIDGFTVMFVEQAGGIVAFEAPEPFFGTESIPASNQAGIGSLTPRVIAHIRETIPGKPITHAVISHHHGDHMGGIRAFAAAGAGIVVAAGDAAAASAALTRPHTILGDAVPATPNVRAVDDRIRIGSGENAVEVINVGPNPHTEANLVFWVPERGVMIQGDLFYFTAGSGFHPGRDRMNRFFANWLRENRLQPRLLYGVHNQGAAGPAALEKMGTDPVF